MSDQIVRSARDYVRGRHAPDWPALLARLRDATDSPEQKAFADEVIEILGANAKNPTQARAKVRDVLKRNGIAVTGR